jgi:hypothetical protein
MKPESVDKDLLPINVEGVEGQDAITSEVQQKLKLILIRD